MRDSARGEIEKNQLEKKDEQYVLFIEEASCRDLASEPGTAVGGQTAWPIRNCLTEI